MLTNSDLIVPSSKNLLLSLFSSLASILQNLAKIPAVISEARKFIGSKLLRLCSFYASQVRGKERRDLCSTENGISGREEEDKERRQKRTL